MHISGKVFTWFVLLATIGAVALSSRALQVRNSWMAKNDKADSDLAALVKQEPELGQKVKDLKAEVDRAEMAWGRPIAGGNGRPNGGSIQVGLPPGQAAHGIKVSDKVYAFKTVGNGETYYAGRFAVSNAAPDVLILQPDFFVRGAGDWINQSTSDLALWQAQGTWRIRKRMPPNSINRFAQLETLLTKADERRQRTQNEMVAKQTRKAEADQSLVDETGTLIGNADLKAKAGNLTQEFVDGLVKAIADEETARDELLKEVDALRREVRDATQAVNQLADGNKSVAAGESDKSVAPPVAANN